MDVLDYEKVDPQIAFPSRAGRFKKTSGTVKEGQAKAPERGRGEVNLSPIYKL